MMKEKKTNKIIFKIILSIIALLSSYGLISYIGLNSKINKAIILLVSLFIYKLSIYVKEIKKDKRLIISTIIFSLLISLSYIIWGKIDINELSYFKSFNRIDLLGFLSIFYISFLSSIGIFNFLNKKAKDNRIFIDYKYEFSKGDFIKYAFIIFILSLPYLFAFFPGNVSSDSFWSISQSVGTLPYSNHHSIIFTLFSGIFIKFGILSFGKKTGLIVGIFTYIIVQMILLSCIYSYFVIWLKTKGVKKVYVYITLIFFSLNPIIISHSITYWKDVLFSSLVLIYITLLFDYFESRGEIFNNKKNIIAYIILGILIALLRNNGLYIFIFTSLIISIYTLVKGEKIFLFSSILVIFIAIIIQGPIYNFFKVEKPSFREASGLMIQQLSYTSINSNDVFEDKDMEFLNNIMDENLVKESYNPFGVDDIKFHKEFNDEFLNENKGDFIKIWIKYFFKAPKDYFKSWVLLTRGYINIDTNSYSKPFGVSENNLGGKGEFGKVESVDLYDKYLGINVSRRIENNYMKLFNKSIISLFTRVSFLAWLNIYFIYVHFNRRDYKMVFTVLPLFGLWFIILLAAPFSNSFRYLYALYLAMPYLILFLFYITNKSSSYSFRKSKDG